MQQGKNIFHKYLIRFVSVILFFVTAFSTPVVKSESNEYNVKAMFILNFIKYIEWPQDYSNSIFKIGIIGKCGMADALRGMTINRNETKQIVVEEIKDES